MYKLRLYGVNCEVLYIDGKFRSAILMQRDSFGFYKCTNLYFMYNGSIHLFRDYYHNYTGKDLEAFRSGDVTALVEQYKNSFEPGNSFRRDFKSVIKSMTNANCTVIVHNEFTSLWHYRNRNFIAASTKRVPHGAVLDYENEKFTYASRMNYVDDDVHFHEGYPDLEDSSVQMNFMLSGGNVEHLREVLELFKEYTKHMDIKY